MQSLKLSKEGVLIRSKWRQLIRGTEEDIDDSGFLVGVNVIVSWPRLTWVILD